MDVLEDGCSRPRAWVNLGLVSGSEHAEQSRPHAGVEPVALAAAPYLTRGIELDALLVAIVDTIVDRLAAERGTLYLVDGRTRTLNVVSEEGQQFIAGLRAGDQVDIAFTEAVAVGVRPVQ